MKKKILLIVLASFMIMGVVSAASIWGTYKGYSKVKIVTDGNDYTGSTVPSVLVSGQVMIPITILSKIGVPYYYDSNKQTATINSVKVSSSGSSSDINNLKLYSDGSSSFQGLRTLSDSFGFLNRDLMLTSFNLPNNPEENLQASLKALNNLINEYNALITPTNSQAQKLRNSGLSSAAVQLENAITKYSSAIDYYKLAYQSLEKFDSDPNYYQSYLDNDADALKLIGEAVSISNSGFSAFQTMIQNYKTTNVTSTPEYVPPVIVTPSTINSRIDGDFDGFEYDKIFLLQNGQIWKQTSFDIKLSLKLNPKVTIFKDGSSYYMIVDGVDKKVKVTQIK